jgi:putative PIN family toxin of toxin-antitoxin system
VPHRVVLDTSVLVAAVRSDQGASRALLVAALDQRYALLASVPLMIEYEAVLTRREHLEVSGLSADDIGAILDALAVIAEPVRLAYLWRPALRDTNDDMVLETAVNGRADFLVTFNRRDFESVAARFGLEVRGPAQALERLRRQS